MSLNESTVEDAALGWSRLRAGMRGQVSDLGYAVGHGPAISSGGETLTLAISRQERVVAGWRCRGGRLERRLKP